MPWGMCRTRPSVASLLIVGLMITTAGVAACSSDRPPPASGSGASSSGSVGSSSGGPSDAGGDALSSSSGGDASSDGGADAGVIPCYGDAPLTTDGGAAPLDCAGSPTCAAHCTRIRDNYRVAVAQAAIQCILKLPSCTSLTDVRACTDLGIGNACAVGTSAAYCTPLVTSCDPAAGQPGSNIDQAGCERFAHALSPAGRTTFSTCIQSKVTAGTCPVEVITCANEVRQ